LASGRDVRNQRVRRLIMVQPTPRIESLLGCRRHTGCVAISSPVDGFNAARFRIHSRAGSS
jgi:hypothetical protein